MNKEQLAKIRQEIYYNEKTFEKLVTDKSFKSLPNSLKDAVKVLQFLTG